MAKINLLFKPSCVIYQKATFLNIMVIHVRKPDKKKIFHLESNKKINSEKDLKKVELCFAAERKQEVNSLENMLQKS